MSDDKLNRSPGKGIYRDIENEEPEPIKPEVLTPTQFDEKYNQGMNTDQYLNQFTAQIDKFFPFFLVGAGLIAVAAIALMIKEKKDEKPSSAELPKTKTITTTIYKKVKDDVPEKTTKTTEPKKKIDPKAETLKKVEEIEEI